MIAPPRRARFARVPRQGFTLIELLVVIAIIAILTAILLPVFASVREGSRQGVAISNMKDIQQKMEQFKLDNHRYPEVLFGYADGQGSMKDALGRAQAAGTAAAYFPGLYPAYIKDVEVFTDPNNTVNTSDANKITPEIGVNLIAPCVPANDERLSGLAASGCTPVVVDASAHPPTYAPGPGATVSSQRSFYMADAYDSGPMVTGGNQVSTTFLPRYQTAREGTACNGTLPIGCDSAVVNDTYYKRQLRWQNPPADTVITMTSHHVQNADKVLVLFESGAVKKVRAEDFQLQEGTPTFWKTTP